MYVNLEKKYNILYIGTEGIAMNEDTQATAILLAKEPIKIPWLSHHTRREQVQTQSCMLQP